jgi:hypothetical protein
LNVQNLTMNKISSIRHALMCSGAAILLAGCVANQSKPERSEVPAVAAVAEIPVAPVPEVKVEARPVCKDEVKPALKAKARKPVAKSKAAAVSVDCVSPGRGGQDAVSASLLDVAYDLSKNKPVMDSARVEAGQGTWVKGVNDWQGEVSGVPASSSQFARLKIGMSQKQVLEFAGEPSYQGAYVPDKSVVPFYFGSDQSRWEMVYKGLGRLIFSNQSGSDRGYYLTWVIHNASEGGQH